MAQYAIDCDFKRRLGYVFSQKDDRTDELEDIYEPSLRAGCDVTYVDDSSVPKRFDKVL